MDILVLIVIISMGSLWFDCARGLYQLSSSTNLLFLGWIFVEFDIIEFEGLFVWLVKLYLILLIESHHDADDKVIACVRTN